MMKSGEFVLWGKNLKYIYFGGNTVERGEILLRGKNILESFYFGGNNDKEVGIYPLGKEFL